MKNRESLLLIVIMIVSASLVALLYSPVVTKNDFGSDGFGLNPGVNYGGKVENAKKRDNSFSIPDRSMPIFTSDASSYANSINQKSGNSFSESTEGGQYNSNYTVRSTKGRNLTQNVSQTSGFSGMSQNAVGNTFTKSRGNQADDQEIMSLNTSNLGTSQLEIPKMPVANYRLSSDASANGFMSIVSDLSSNLTDNNAVMQKKGGDNNDDALAPPASTLPIPDGTYFLLFLTAGYFLLKRRWLPKSKRVSTPVREEEYQMHFAKTNFS